MRAERRYWWVNHSRTFVHEVGGNYIWSPKVDRDGRRNQAYDFMTELKPGDVVFSYAKKMIRAVGFVQAPCYFYPRPEEFGKVGIAWNELGWRVDVRFERLATPIAPRAKFADLRALLPKKYSPLTIQGWGQQKLYLANISKRAAELLAEELPLSLRAAVSSLAAAEDGLSIETELPGQGSWEDSEETKIESDARLTETTRIALVKARRGQGIFKENVFQFERNCRVTHVDNPSHLVASHIKPWRVSSNEERLAGSNGLLLTPTIDHLFDRGFISFEDSGDLIISPVAESISLSRMGVLAAKPIKKAFTADQRHFLDFHRDVVLLRKRV